MEVFNCKSFKLSFSYRIFIYSFGGFVSSDGIIFTKTRFTTSISITHVLI